MIPAELSPRTLRVPMPTAPTIALLTGAALRHRRFALRMQQEFGAGVIAWFEVGTPRHAAHATTRTTQGRRVAAQAAATGARLLRERGATGTLRAATGLPGLAWAQARTVLLARRRQRRQRRAERQLFAREVERLEPHAVCTPQRVDDPRCESFVARMRALHPTFILTLGGPLYPPALLDCAHGLAINQHAGWSPDYRGSCTTEWALYHRDLARVGSTVHVMTSGADAGPILRRSQACLVAGDSPEHCFARVVALGTELMVDAVRELQERAAITVYDQPPRAGQTYRSRELSGNVLRALERDHAHGWLSDELKRLQRY